jgi:hypothetical protein
LCMQAKPALQQTAIVWSAFAVAANGYPDIRRR